MTKKELQSLNRFYAEMEDAESDFYKLEQIIRWYKEDFKGFDLQLSLIGRDGNKSEWVDIKNCFEMKELECWLSRLKRRLEKYKIIADGLKYQLPDKI